MGFEKLYRLWRVFSKAVISMPWTNSENTRYMVNLRDSTSERLNSDVADVYQPDCVSTLNQASSLDKERLIIQEEWRGKPLTIASRD